MKVEYEGGGVNYEGGGRGRKEKGYEGGGRGVIKTISYELSLKSGL